MKNFKYKNVFALCALAVSLQVNAQQQRLVADYPLIDNLEDSTGINNNVYLEGNPNLPTLPSSENALCSNGIYIIDENGQNIETPILPFLDVTNFTIEVEFNVTELPSPTGRTRMPIIMGSRFARWLGIYISADGFLGYKYNNDSTNYVWSNTGIPNTDDWYSSKISYVNGHVELFLNDPINWATTHQ